MLTFEHCAKCGELRIDHDGATTESRCVKCAAIELHALAKRPQYDDTIAPADYPAADHRRQIRIMTLISGRIEEQNGSHGFKILDISKSGAKLRTTEELPNGILTLAFPGAGTLHAKLAWRDGLTRGVTFLEPSKDVIATVGKAMPYLGPMLRVA